MEMHSLSSSLPIDASDITSRKQARARPAADACFLRAQTEVAQVALADLGPEELPEKLLAAIARARGYTHGALWRVLGDGQEAVMVAGFGAHIQPFVGSWHSLTDLSVFVGQIINLGQPAYVNRVPESPIAAWPISQALQPQALLGLPLRDRSGRVAGAMIFASTDASACFTERDLSQGVVLASQVAQALENSKLFHRLRRLEERYRIITESLTEAVYTCDLEGRMTYGNAALERLTGYRVDELLGDPGRKFFDANLSPVLMDRRRRALRGEAVPAKMEAEVIRRDGSRVPVELTASNLTRDEWVVGRVMVLRDISEHKRAQAELERRRREAEVVADLAPGLNASLHLDTVLQRLVEGARELCNSERALIALREGESDVAFFRYQVGSRYAQYATLPIEPGKGVGGKVLLTGQPIRTDHYVEDPKISKHYLDIVQMSGVVATLAVPIRIGSRVEGVLYVINRASHPFTDRDEEILVRLADHAAIAIRNAQLFAQVRAGRERLQALSRQMVKVQEDERRHIARELHDEVGQLLTGLKLSLNMSTTGDARDAYLGEAQALVQDLMARVREISLDLRPAMLDDLGLLPALWWYLERYTARTQVQVTFKHTGLERRLPPEVETAVYRLVQEGLTNVARHAEVGEAVVRVWVDTEVVGVEIEDAGRGFDARRLSTGGSTSGLTGMFERVNLLGGQLWVDSTPGMGTRVTGELPLAHSLERRTRER